MLFRVENKGYQPDSSFSNTAFLIIDEWNDWWEFRTMYTLVYVDETGKCHHIGSVKIGEFSMKKEQERPNLPTQFQQLDEAFFSLGQDDYYYETLNTISPQVRTEVLQGLNDIALNENILTRALDEHVTTQSLLRDITLTTVKKQFRRIANGGARLTKYEFTYTTAPPPTSGVDPMTLSFEVTPESNPPTNIHVLIGRNGVGKTHLIKNMITSITTNNEINTTAGFFISDEPANTLFANIIYIAFSAFDKFPDINNACIPYIHIGLPEEGGLNNLAQEFVKSLKICLTGPKCILWENAIKTLESDPIFSASGVNELVDLKYQKEDFDQTASYIFQNLSSGHKIIILTLTKLIEKVEEKSLVFLDEPEGHLHPPLLSAFIRALSNLLVNRNGVAIIATHSPVILQEVPKSCVWKLRRTGWQSIAERLDIESFGENIGSLISEVFSFEVTDSGFHNLLNETVKKYDSYGQIIDHFNHELGMEARGILKALLAVKKQEQEEEK